MQIANNQDLASDLLLREKILDYMQLTKPRLTTMVVFTAVLAFLLASSFEATALSMVILAIGGYCVAGASNALNQVLEKDYDALMTRTKLRPMASGRMKPAHGVLFSGLLCLVGVTLLALFNPLTAFFGMLAFILYAFLYTPLKRFSSAAIFVGAVAGAMPMLIGAVAWSGQLTWLAIALFAIQLAWQYPHFWSIGFLGFRDYQNAGFRFVPSTDGMMPDRRIGISSIGFSVALLLCCFGLFYIGEVSIVGLIGLEVVSLGYLLFSVLFYNNFNKDSARQLMFSSLLYLPVVLIILSLDKF